MDDFILHPTGKQQVFARVACHRYRSGRIAGWQPTTVLQAGAGAWGNGEQYLRASRVTANGRGKSRATRHGEAKPEMRSFQQQLFTGDRRQVSHLAKTLSTKNIESTA